jgi:hypothetical protein
VAILVKKKGGSIPPELGNPVVFTRDYVKHRLFSTTTYGQGTRRVASLRRSTRIFSVKSRTMTSAYRRAARSYVKCASITSQPSLESIRH